MELARPSYAVVYVILLCALAQGGSEGKRSEAEELFRDGGGGGLSSSLHMDVKQAEKVWKHCRKKLIERNNDVKDFDLHPLEGSSDMRSILLIEKNIHQATQFLSPHMKEDFFDCIRASSPPTPVSEEKEGSRYRLNEYSGTTFGLASGRRRSLLANSPEDQMPPRPATVPSPGPAFGSPSQGPAPAISPTPEAPDSLSLPPNMFLPFPPPPRPPRPPTYRPIVYVPTPPPPNQEDKQQKPIIFAAAVAGSIILIGLFLCHREVRNNNKVDKEAKPFLVLTSSDFSGGPGSQKFDGLGNSDKEEPGIDNGKNPSNVRNWSIKLEDNNTSLAETTSSEGMGQVPAPPLEPPTGKPAPPPPPAPAPAPAPAPRPPPPPRAAHPPPPAPPRPMAGRNQHSPLGPLRRNQGSSSEGGEPDAPKPKLKPFFWDKVSAKPDQAMVWHEISAGSFQFNEEMMESLFGFGNQNRNERKKDSPSLEPTVQYIKIIDPKKAQNLSILLRALNVTTAEVIDALKEGNEIPFELIQTLLKMAPTTEEELKLRLFTGDLSQLGPAERFLKVLVDIPFAFKRLEALMFMFTHTEEFSGIKESFATLEVACNELKKSRLFLKLLEAVLKTGNRMNDGTYRGGAQAFRLDTLLKLSDVKGTDGKTTLLHFVVQEIIRSEGIRAVRTEKASRSMSSVKTEDMIDDASEESAEHYRSLGLQVVSGLSTELADVKKAALIDGDALAATVSKLSHSLTKTKEFLDTDLKNLEEDSEFQSCLESFVENARKDISWLLEEEKRIMALVKSAGDYFHGNAGKDEGLRLFVIVRDFLIILDKVCKEVKDATMKPAKPSSKKEAPSASSSPETRHHPPSDLHRRLFPAIAERRVNYSSSDDDDDEDDDESLSP